MNFYVYFNSGTNVICHANAAVLSRRVFVVRPAATIDEENIGASDLSSQMSDHHI